MKSPKHIMPAIQALQESKTKVLFPQWLIVLDYALAGLILLTWFGTLAFLIYKILTWLL